MELLKMATRLPRRLAANRLGAPELSPANMVRSYVPSLVQWLPWIDDGVALDDWKKSKFIKY